MTKRVAIDPKKLRKHSDIVKAEIKTNQFVVVGEKEQTLTGYKVAGTTCGDFETYYEYMADGVPTDRFIHPSKSRSYRVIAGQGVLIVSKDGANRAIALIPGTEVTAVPGIAYQLRSSPQAPLEVYVTQAANYEEELRVAEPSTANPANVSEDMLRTVTREEVLAANINDSTPRRRPRGQQKAVQQQVEKALAAGRAVAAPEAIAAVEVNLPPTMVFDDEGAG